MIAGMFETQDYPGVAEIASRGIEAVEIGGRGLSDFGVAQGSGGFTAGIDARTGNGAVCTEARDIAANY